ncbi:type IV conjugative transfer system lipoprotein TraV [Vibrio sp. 10N]|uniref:type IV conjugative transfer system lipoprotein TraV n=1 Tax=Vibrio sp. 10N TaxID=3058938 RepID=UPI0028135923|nr:hypothetical protein VB10N_46710 [Vibrio sp. 10N]
MIYRNYSTLALSVLALSGCSIGQSEFTCSMGSESSICASSRTIYKATNGDIEENETITYVEDGERKQMTVAELEAMREGTLSPDKKGEIKKDNYAPRNDFKQINTGKPKPKVVYVPATVVEPKMPYSYSYDGQALRSDAKVMRIWISPWVDVNDTLHMSKVLFTDMEKKKWTIADSSQLNRPQTTLTKPVVTKTTATNPQGDEPKKRAFVPPPPEIEKLQQMFPQNTQNGD